MKVTLISTQGPWLEAEIQAEKNSLFVMDEFSIDERFAPQVGEEFEVELGQFLDEDESWEEIFGSNPKMEKKIERIEGWRYRAYGEVKSIRPVVVDCGLFDVEDVIQSNDERVIGSYVGFTITRLEATARN